MNSLVCIGIPTTSGWQGASGWAGSKLEWGEQAGARGASWDKGEWAPYMCSTVYAWSHIHLEPYMHGAVYTWSCICMEPYTHGAIYAWSHIRMEPYVHGAIYAWSRMCMEPYTCGASSLPLLPACFPCSLSIPGSLELSWGLRKSPAHSPCFQLTPLAPSLFPLLPHHSWTPGTPWSLRKLASHSPCSQLAALAPWAYLGPWNFPGALESLQLTSLAPSLLPSLPACSPYSLSIPGPLGPPWGLRKPPAHYFQLALLAPWASLGPWTSLRPQEAPSLLPLLHEHPWVTGTSLTPSWLQLTPSWLPMANEQFSMYWNPHHLWVARG